MGITCFALCVVTLLSGVDGKVSGGQAQALSERHTLLDTTPTAAPSPVGTLTAAESEQRIRRLLKDNAGCKLPCWWGIVPGESTKADVIQVVEQLNPIYVVTNGSENSEFGESVVVKYGAPLKGRNDQYFLVKNGRVAFIRASTFNAGHTKLERVLAAFGEPDVILVSAGISPENSKWYVTMDLHYTRLGINVTYATVALVRGNRLLACFATRSFENIGIVTWDVKNVPERALNNTLPRPGEDAKPLEEVSRETRKSVFRRYSRAGSTYCLPIDADKWGY
jgi:hypothetical protein